MRDIPGAHAIERVSAGIEGLDKMLHGGLIAGRPYIVTGPAGSGKSIVAMHFLREGLDKGEDCMLVALDEPPSEVKLNIATFGWNLDRLTALDATPDIRVHKKKNIIDVGTTLDVRDMEEVKDVRKSLQLRTMEVTVHSLQKMIKQSQRDLRERSGRRYSRIAIDSMTALKRFSLRGEDVRILVQSFLRFLSELEVTTLIISNPLDAAALDSEFLVARGEFLMHKWIEGHRIRRAISIERMRGTAFDDRLRPVSIGPKGMTVHADATVPATGPFLRTVDRPFLEGRAAELVSAKMEEVLGAIEQVRSEGGETAEAEAAFLRVLVAMHQKRTEEAAKHLVNTQAKLEEEMRLLRAARRGKEKK